MAPESTLDGSGAPGTAAHGESGTDQASPIHWPHGVPDGLAEQIPPAPAHGGVIVRGLDGAVLGANSTAAELLRLSWNRLLSTNANDNWQPIDEHGLPIYTDQRPRPLTTRTGRRDEQLMGLSLPSPDGAPDRLVWLNMTTSLAVDGSGAPVATIGVFTDLTETARGRSATDRVLASYRDLADNVTDFVLRTAVTGVIEWASPSVTAASGWQMSQVIGKTSVEFEHPDDAARSRDLMRRVMAGERAQGRCRLLCADGTHRWFVISSGPILTPDGSVTGGVHGFTSIDALVDAERSAESERAILRASLDGLADPYVVLAAARSDTGAIDRFIVTEANPAACDFLEVPRAELLGGPLFAPLPTALAEHLIAVCIEVLTSGLSRSLNGVHSADSGGDRWYDIRVSPVGDGVSILLRNVTSEHLARQAVDESQHRYRMLAENASDIVLMIDPNDRYIWVSPSAHEATGWSVETLMTLSPIELIHPDDLAAVMTQRDDFAGGRVMLAPFRIRGVNGDYRWVSAAIREVRDKAGALVGRIVSLRDVHEETLARRALEASEEMFRAVMTTSSTGMILCDPTGRIEVVNEAICRMLQQNEAWFLTRHTDDLVHPDDLPALQELRSRVLASGGTPPINEMRLLRSDGVAIWARRAASVIRDEHNQPQRLVVQLEDVTAERDAREELRFHAFNDLMTGMHNRAWILNALELDLAEAQRTNGVVGVLFIDLDNFKLINDSLGHVAGDEVLAEIAERMMAAMRPEDRVGRFGGDEFVVVVPNGRDAAAMEQTAANLATALGTELTIHGHRIMPTVSIGIALSTPESTAASLLRDTDSALFRAKRSGRARWQFFDATMHSQAMSRLTIEDEIRSSLLAGDFVVHYQPVVALADQAVVGYEALARWQHPERGLLSPAEFLAVAEESGLIVGIGRAVLDQVCAVLAAHPDAAGTININVSAVELARDDWAGMFTATVERHGVDPSRLIVEVTETAVLSLRAETVAGLVGLRDLGVGLHVDDFGTGFSSISLLRDLPVTGLKLDASFVADLGDGDRDAHALAAGLAGLVTHLGLTGVAEGIETAAQADALHGQGWLHGQGYHFGRPAPWAG